MGKTRWALQGLAIWLQWVQWVQSWRILTCKRWQVCRKMSLSSLSKILMPLRKELKWDQTAVDHIVGQWYSEQAGAYTAWSWLGTGMPYRSVAAHRHGMLWALQLCSWFRPGTLWLFTPWTAKRLRELYPDDVGWIMLSKLPSECQDLGSAKLQGSDTMTALSNTFYRWKRVNGELYRMVVNSSWGRDGSFLQRQVLYGAQHQHWCDPKFWILQHLFTVSSSHECHSQVIVPCGSRA